MTRSEQTFAYKKVFECLIEKTIIGIHVKFT